MREPFRNLKQYIVVVTDANFCSQSSYNFWSIKEAEEFGNMMFLQDNYLDIKIYSEEVKVFRSKRAIRAINRAKCTKDDGVKG